MMVTRHWPQEPPPPQAGGDKNPVAGQRVQQFVTRRGADLFIRFVIDLNNHVARVHQL
ncbi:hypothetical protein LNO36_05500 [Klebsiella variicola subsp. variicola]|nr:hypothetical protein [Klebsiella variicola subsp. variicola]